MGKSATKKEYKGKSATKEEDKELTEEQEKSLETFCKELCKEKVVNIPLRDNLAVLEIQYHIGVDFNFEEIFERDFVIFFFESLVDATVIAAENPLYQDLFDKLIGLDNPIDIFENEIADWFDSEDNEIKQLIATAKATDKKLMYEYGISLSEWYNDNKKRLTNKQNTTKASSVI